MEPKVQHYAIHKWIVAFLVSVMSANDVVCQTVSCQEEVANGIDSQKIEIFFMK